jgi:transcriptional regulator with XRE-family HTH domain
MDMIGRIRRLHSRKKKSEREISRITGLSRNTVAKWLHGEVDGPPKYRRGAQPNKLTAFHDALKVALRADAPVGPSTSVARPRRCTPRSRLAATTAATRA